MNLFISRIAFFAFIFLSKTWACSYSYEAAYKFDPKEFIFIGKVAAHIVSSGIHPQSVLKNVYYGFIVEVKEEIYLPEKPKEYFEIYPLECAADCREIPYTLKLIELFFPIGSEVRIVAKKSYINFDNSNELNIQLIASPFNNFRLSINFSQIPTLVSTKESIYNYKYSNTDSLNSLISQLVNMFHVKELEHISVIVNSVNSQMQFELRKDLYRLYSYNDDEEKARIIYRIKDYSAIESYKIIFMIFEYIRDTKIRKRLLVGLFDFREKSESLDWIIHNK